MQLRKKKIPRWIGALSFIITFLSGCLKDNPPSAPRTYISVMHLAPRAPSVEIYFDNTKASSSISSGSVSTAYTGVDPGFFAITFKKVSSDSVVASIPADMYDSSKYYTLLLYNDGTATARAVSIADDFSVLTGEKAYYRFFHMSPDIDTVDLYIGNVIIQSGRRYADNITQGYLNEFLPLTADRYTLYVKKAGTDSIIAQTSTTLYQANAYTIFLKGLPASSGSASTLELGVMQASN